MTRTAGIVPLARLNAAGTEYTYIIPEELDGALEPGHLVHIPFARTKVSGVVTRLGGDEKRPRLRPLLTILSEETVLLPHQLALARWISGTYRAPLSDTLGAMLPPQAKKGDAERRSTHGTQVQVHVTPVGREAAADEKALGRKRVQRRILERLLDSHGPVMERDLMVRPAWRKEVIELERLGMVRRQFVEPLSRCDPKVTASVVGPSLSDEQRTAVEAVGASRGHCVFLLHGVTGSGKTEVYMQVIAQSLRRGLGAVVMVPEISLTPQTLRRFEERFPGEVAILHSGQTGSRRLGEWKRVRRGEARIVVGPRSALFAPIPRLGLIVLDEEHDASYKQNESPRYHAREAAIRLGEMLEIPVVLGSATPDVCTYYRARKQNVTLLSLARRPLWARPLKQGNQEDVRLESRPMPTVEIVDMRQELKAGHRGIFSRALLEQLEATLHAKQQAILFLNRRGAASAVVCRTCGHVVECSRCDAAMSYHSTRKALICHRCNRRSRPPERCPQCGGQNIRYLGAGTQRVVEEVERLFPENRVLRWDRDTAARRDGAQSLEAFARHEADVLVGTQMVAKGHDFPLVTLVGVVLADVGLHLPDFRAAERTFQLLTQVAGRGGRAGLRGRVIVQTYTPDHYAVQAAKDHDYWKFYGQEMRFRLASAYPPFARLIRLLLRGGNASHVERRALALRAVLDQEASSRGITDLELIGPAPAFTSRVNTIYQWHLLLRGKEPERLLGVVPDDVFVDVDPVDLL